jgi:hypothetical protein
VFLIVTVVFSILLGRSTVSSIHRYMTNKIDWLREVTGLEEVLSQALVKAKYALSCL